MDLKYWTVLKCVTKPLLTLRLIKGLLKDLDVLTARLGEQRTELGILRQERDRLAYVTRLYAGIKYGTQN